VSRFKAPFYYSYDDLHNPPYISGPWSEEEFREKIVPSDADEEFFEELVETGTAENMGERYELWDAEKLEEQIKEQLEQIRKIRAGESLP
jgi:hypothetical protein